MGEESSPLPSCQAKLEKKARIEDAEKRMFSESVCQSILATCAEVIFPLLPLLLA